MSDSEEQKEVLFTITRDNLETGMRGVPVGYCPTSSVDPHKGLFYAGKPVSELAQRTPEQVIYLLVHRKEGSDSEVDAFARGLHERARCAPEVSEYVRRLPRQGHPMKLFCAALVLLGTFEATGDYREDCLNLIAKIPELVATVINHHAGWGGIVPSQPEMGYMENFAQMLNVPDADIQQLTEVFALFNVLHYDHGGGNLSCFVGKAVASGLEDLYGSLSASMAALAGPRHGRANQDCLDFVKQVYDEVGENATEADVEKLIRQRLDRGELIYGFGHAVLRVEDPRATVLYRVAQSKYSNNPLVKIASLLRSAGEKVLGENPKIQDPHVNVDAISGTLLSAAGFSYPEYYTMLFGLARVVGIAVQIVYERTEARDGKGTPIIRPKYYYLGDKPS